MAKVLVVDDEAMVVRVIQRGLRALGHSATAVTNGADALAAYTAEYDLVLLDHTMSPLDGADTFRALKERHPHARVVLMTGIRDERVEALMAEGMAGFLPKPFVLDQLQTAIENALR